MIFSTETLFEIYRILQKRLIVADYTDIIEFDVIDPDISSEFSGTDISISGKKYIYRPYKVWVDLAEILHCRMMTPQSQNSNLTTIRYRPLNIENSWHKNSGIRITEKYGVGSEFFRIRKLEEPYFLNDYVRALDHVSIFKGMKILNLGVNRGDEFQILKDIYKDSVDSISFTGIDHCKSALETAEIVFNEDNFKFINEDIADISSIDLPKQDLMISVGTLQSPNINGKEIFRYVVKNLMTKNSSLILGFPNSRYIDREVVYGAKTKNYTEPNMNLLIKDLGFYKKYLQQHKFKIITFGKYYIFMVAVR